MILLKQHSSESQESSKDKEDAGDDPGWDGGESFNVGRVCRDVGEDVDQHEEEGHQQGHPTRNYFRWDQKACLQEQKT